MAKAEPLAATACGDPPESCFRFASSRFFCLAFCFSFSFRASRRVAERVVDPYRLVSLAIAATSVLGMMAKARTARSRSRRIRSTPYKKAGVSKMTAPHSTAAAMYYCPRGNVNIRGKTGAKG